MLEMIGFGEPIDHDVGPKLSQHVIAQDRIEDAALLRSGPEPAQDRLVRGIRERYALARLPKGIDQDPDALRGARVDQECAPGCPRTLSQNSRRRTSCHVVQGFPQGSEPEPCRRP